MTDADPSPTLREVRALRYVLALREGGSLPGVVEADDLGTYVVKFRGAGQGPKALVAEVIAGELGRAVGLPVPRLAVVTVDPELARAEPDPTPRPAEWTNRYKFVYALPPPGPCRACRCSDRPDDPRALPPCPTC